jgi:hypothetical protein
MFIKQKRFDKVNGEIRKCNVCDTDFHTHKPVYQCRKCVARKIYDNAREKYGEGIIPTGKFAGMPHKKPYPFDTRSFENRKRFDRIKRELNQCKTKEERRQHYAKQLEEIMHNGVWEWILDRRDDETVKKRKAKSKTMTQTDYPDTRNYYEE